MSAGPPGEGVESLRAREHHRGQPHTLVYLPGLHGDWTLAGNFRRALRGRLHVVEFTYPRTISWSLEDYAAAIEAELLRLGVDTPWLLGESFGSQVLWALVKRGRIAFRGLMLAGGFVRHPVTWGVRFAGWSSARVPLPLVARGLAVYAVVARWRFRRSPEMAGELKEFIARRTEPDRRAATHRLRLIADNDPRPTAGVTRGPIYALTGLVDPIVPWMLVRPWLRRHCPALQDYRVVLRADHNVLGTAPEAAAEIITGWIQSAPAA